MEGLAQSVGNGISGVFGGALESIGRALHGIVDAAARVVPSGAPVFVLAFVVVAGAAWLLLKR